MDPVMLLQIALELRERAAAAYGRERADLLFLAEEYEDTARQRHSDQAASFSVKLPK